MKYEFVLLDKVKMDLLLISLVTVEPHATNALFEDYMFRCINAHYSSKQVSCTNIEVGLLWFESWA